MASSSRVCYNEISQVMYAEEATAPGQTTGSGRFPTCAHLDLGRGGRRERRDDAMTVSPSQSPSSTEAVHISELVSCPKCEHSNAPDLRYCDNCGDSLSGASPAKAAATKRKRQGFLTKLFGRKK